VIEDPERAVAIQRSAGGLRRRKLSQLCWEERRHVLVDGPGGLEPAAFWLSEYGTPVAAAVVHAWPGVNMIIRRDCRNGHGVAAR
jgi:hypothetical protein